MKHNIDKSVQIQLYNTETRNKEVFHTEKEVSLYTCGPTVYNHAHIGNFRTYVFEDILKRTLLFFGYKVHHVMNLTDVDDKTINGAIQNNVSLNEYTQPFINSFFEDIDLLGICPAKEYPRATEFIPAMIEAITDLISKGYAYQSKDLSVYFSVEKMPLYGRLSKISEQELKIGSRVSQDEYEKDCICDFVLWKAHNEKRDGNIYWDSPFGKGRPGWHLECSIMASALLGKTIDIHAGGVDNIFPHHDNEIVQSEALYNQTFVKLWMHSEHLLVNGKKMSKSLNNFFTVKDLLAKGYSGAEIRYMLIQSHYRMQLNFTDASAEGCKQSLSRLQEFVYRLHENYPDGIVREHIQEILNKSMTNFKNAIANDLNIASALSHIFDLMNSIYHEISKILYNLEATLILQILEQMNSVINVLSFEKPEIPPLIKQLLEKRLSARSNKDWNESDRIRNEIDALGFLVEDSVNGQRVKIK